MRKSAFTPMQKICKMLILAALLYNVSTAQAQSKKTSTGSPIIPAELTLIAGSLDGMGANDGTVQTAHFALPELEGREISKGIAVDSHGNLYVAEANSNVIRKISNQGEVTTIAGQFKEPGNTDGPGNEARFFGPLGLAIDKNDTLYVADTGNASIREIRRDGSVHTLLDNSKIKGMKGSGSKAFRLVHPTGVAVDPRTGDIYFADSGNSTIQKVSPSGDVQLVAGNGSAPPGFENGRGEEARFKEPIGLTIGHDDSIYVVDAGNDAIRKISQDGLVTTVICDTWPDKRVCENQNNNASSPTGVLEYATNELYISTSFGIFRFNESTSSLEVVKKRPEGDYELLTPERLLGTISPGELTKDDAGNIYFTSDTVVVKILPSGQFTAIAGSYPKYGSQDGKGPSATFNRPNSLVVDSKGNLFVGDQGNTVIRKIDLKGVVSTIAGHRKPAGYYGNVPKVEEFDAMAGLAIDEKNNLFIGDRRGDTIKEISPSGEVSIIAGKPYQSGLVDGDASNARIQSPGTLAYDSNRALYVIDSSVIRKIDLTKPPTSDLFVTTITRTSSQKKEGVRPGQFSSDSICGLSVDKNHNLVVLDDLGIKLIDPSGKVTPVGNHMVVERRIYKRQELLRPSVFSLDDNNQIIYAIGNKLGVMDMHGNILGEIEAKGAEHSVLEDLSELGPLGAPKEIVSLGNKSFALLVGNAVLKITLK